MNKYFIVFIVSLFFVAPSARAGLSDLSFPIKELGNCSSIASCRLYCDKKENIETCLAFALNQGLVSSDSVEKFNQFTFAVKDGGPGKCSNVADCKSYCGIKTHYTECLSFTEKNSLLDASQLNKAKKMADLLETGKSLPGNCKDSERCVNYCSIPAHEEECNKFVTTNNVVTLQEQAFRKIKWTRGNSAVTNGTIRPAPTKIVVPTPVRQPELTPDLNKLRGMYTNLPNPASSPEPISWWQSVRRGLATILWSWQ